MDAMSDGMNRRRFLKVLGVTGGGSAALSGCSTDRVEKLITYLVPPPNQVPGRSTWYASTCGECEAGCGVHVRVREGRAVKVEGNPDSPINRGKLCARGQASLQGLYNPDRVRGPMARVADGWEEITWDDAIGRVAGQLGSVDPSRVWFLTGQQTGSFNRLVDEWMSALGSDHRVVYEAFAYEALRHANRAIFGIDAIPQHDFDAAHVVVSFGADFLDTWLNPVEHARDFADGHAFRDGSMGKFIHIEPRMSMTGTNADEWLAPTPGTEALVALAMAQVIVAEGVVPLPADLFRVQALLDAHTPDAVASRCGIDGETITRIAHEFAAGSSIAVAGGTGAQHSQAHITAQAVNILNYVAGNIDTTVRFTGQSTGAARYQDLAQLTSAMRGGQVGVLFTHSANPVYSTPAASGFTDAIQQVGFKVSFSQFLDETTAMADLVLPDHDPLEQWNDSEPRSGHYALKQPAMQPVFDTRQTGDVLIQVAQQAGGGLAASIQAATYKQYVEQSWRTVQRQMGDREDFATFWHAALQAGGVWRDVATRTTRFARTAGDFTDAPVWEAPGGDTFTLITYPTTALHDGRGANRPWLQELPDPVSKITWGTWIEMHPEKAAERDIHNGDVLEVTTPNGMVSAPAFLYPGIRPDTIAMPLGQGHTSMGRYAEGSGVNTFALLSG
ncbi:MAG: molybdopterin-dependent oxidoreductase, partial [Gemmatimonadales bacterium]